ncbi:MAG TPA: ribonuclease H family protein [Tissierellaceae bacterium]|nr:ribonuclease H family protein [Tissierellaceae bacterium]
MAKYYYAVKRGKNPGIYLNWNECEKEVKGFKGAKYKKFKNKKEALDFISGDGNVLSDVEIDKNDFEHNINDLEDKEIVAYVDGSFHLDTFTYSYGVVLLTKDNKEVTSGREDNRKLAEMRNVAGELKGAMVAMEMALEKNMETLYLHYDYKGIEEWAKGNWKTNKEGTKLYKNYYDSIKDELKVIFIKVLAHSGIKYNEEVDKLAKEALF